MGKRRREAPHEADHLQPTTTTSLKTHQSKRTELKHDYTKKYLRQLQIIPPNIHRDFMPRQLIGHLSPQNSLELVKNKIPDGTTGE